MKAFRMTGHYARAFSAFLTHTTEKSDLFLALEPIIKKSDAHSLLDIGAGDSALAFPLSSVVDMYLAIEPNPNHAASLRAVNIPVIHEPFPCAVAGRYDIVLASHVVPWEEGESERFLRMAWDCVNPGGSFIMITYDEETSEWGRLLSASGLSLTAVGQGHLEGYKKLLASFGRLTVKTIGTRVVADKLDQMLLALSFVYSDGQQRKAARFQKNKVVQGILNRDYRMDLAYSFPLVHYLLMAEKAR